MRLVGFEKSASVRMGKTIRLLHKTVFKAWLNEEFGYD